MMSDPEAKPQYGSLYGILSGILAFLVVIAGILSNSEQIGSWIGRQFSKDPYVVKVSTASVVPSYLKYYYDEEGLAKEQSLYWFRAKVENKTRESLYLEVSFTLVPGDCNSVSLLSKDPFKYSLDPWQTREYTINPPLEINKHDFEGDCRLRINWVIENDRKEKKYTKADVNEITLLPLHTVKWDLVNPNNKPVSREFLLASLAAWSLSREKKVLDRAEQLRRHAGAGSPEQWFKFCYEDLFGGQSGLAINIRERSYPFAGEKTVWPPAQVLSKGEAEPLEAGFLMAAMTRVEAATRGARLALFVLPRAEGAHDPTVLFGWSLPNSDTWEAIDLREAKKMGFKPNLEQSRKLLRQVLDQRPEILQSLKERGVFIGSEPNSPSALAFGRAVEQFKIRALD